MACTSDFYMFKELLKIQAIRLYLQPSCNGTAGTPETPPLQAQPDLRDPRVANAQEVVSDTITCDEHELAAVGQHTDD